MENLFNKSKESTEKREQEFFLELGQKHPNSDKLYQLRADVDNLDKFTEALNKATKDNPFRDLDGDILELDGEEIGKIRVSNTLSPKCLYDSKGHADCGFFFEISAQVKSNKLTKDDIKELVLHKISEKEKIDYINESKGLSE